MVFDSNIMYDIYKPSWWIKRRFHSFIKNDSMGKAVVGYGGQFSKQNWLSDCCSDQNNEFHKIFKSFGPRYLKHLKDISGNDYDFMNAWYQVYGPNTNDSHTYHIHERTELSGIFYIKLRDPSLVTRFRINNQECYPTIKEGQIMTFQSYLHHCSPPNNTNTEKIIVAFNLIRRK